MKYLFVPYDDTPSVIEADSDALVDEATLRAASEGEDDGSMLLRFNKEADCFEVASIAFDTASEDEDEEEGETTYEITGWMEYR